MGMHGGLQAACGVTMVTEGQSKEERNNKQGAVRLDNEFINSRYVVTANMHCNR